MQLTARPVHSPSRASAIDVEAQFGATLSGISRIRPLTEHYVFHFHLSLKSSSLQPEQFRRQLKITLMRSRRN